MTPELPELQRTEPTKLEKTALTTELAQLQHKPLTTELAQLGEPTFSTELAELDSATLQQAGSFSIPSWTKALDCLVQKGSARDHAPPASLPSLTDDKLELGGHTLAQASLSLMQKASLLSLLSKFPYRFRIVDMGLIAATLFADTVSKQFKWRYV